MRLIPRCQRSFRQKHTDGIGQLAVRRDVKDEFRGRRLRVTSQSWPFPDEVILVDITLGAGIGLQPPNRHDHIMNHRNSTLLAGIQQTGFFCRLPEVTFPVRGSLNWRYTASIQRRSWGGRTPFNKDFRRWLVVLADRSFLSSVS